MYAMNLTPAHHNHRRHKNVQEQKIRTY